MDEAVRTNLKAWEELFNSPDPHEHTYPAPFDNIRGLGWLSVIKILRPNKLVPAVQVSKKFLYSHSNSYNQ